MNIRILPLILPFLLLASPAVAQIPVNSNGNDLQLMDQTTKIPAPRFEIQKRGEKYSILDVYTDVYVTGLDEYDQIVSVPLNDTLFLLRKENDCYVFNAVQLTKSEAYAGIDYLPGGFIVSRNGAFGAVDLHQQLVVPCNYKGVTYLPCGDNYFIQVKNDQSGLFDAQGKQILDTICKMIESRGDIIVFQADKYYGFVNKWGKVIQGLDEMRYFESAGVDGWMYCTLSGKNVLLHVPSEKIVVLPKEYDFDKALRINGLSPHFYVRSNSRIGLIDEQGRLLITAKEYTCRSPEDSPVQFMTAKDHALILENNNGKLDFRKVKDFKLVKRGMDGEEDSRYLYALKDESGKYKLVDDQLKPVSETYYKNLEKADVIIAQDLDGKYGAIGEKGEQIIPFVYDRYDSDAWQFTSFVKNGEYFIYDSDHQRIFQDLKITEVDHSLLYLEEYMVFKTGKTKSIVNVTEKKVILGNVISIKIEENAFWINEQDAILVKTPNGEGLFSLRSEKFLIEPVYDAVTYLSFLYGETFLVKVEKSGKYNLYNPQEETFFFETSAEKIYNPKDEQLIKVVKDGDLYLIAGVYGDSDMKVIKTDLQYQNAKFEYEYDLVKKQDEMYIRVTSGKKKGLLREDGSWLHKPELDSYDFYWSEDAYLLVVKNGFYYILKEDGTYVTQQGFKMIDFTGEAEMIAIAYIKEKEYSIYANGEVKEYEVPK